MTRRRMSMGNTEAVPDPDGHLTRRQRREQLTASQWLRRRAEDRVWLTAAAAANGVSPTAYLTAMEERLVAAFGRRRFTFAEFGPALSTLTEEDAAARGRTADELRAQARAQLEESRKRAARGTT